MHPRLQEGVGTDSAGRVSLGRSPGTSASRPLAVLARDRAVELRRKQIAEAWLARMRSGSLVQLKGGDGSNLFLVHDVDGETLLYLSLARHLPADVAVFGLEPRRIAGVPFAHATIEEMAAFHLEAVRRKQPHGPYLLGGLCAGGVIAYEMAAQLLAAGESVGLVLLLETAMPRAVERLGIKQRLTRFKQAVMDYRGSRPISLRQLGAIVFFSVRKASRALRAEITERSSVILWMVARYHLMRTLLLRIRRWPRFVPALSVRQIYTFAHERYVPSSMTLPSIVLVRGSTGEGDDTPYREVFVDDSFGWRTYVPQLTVIDVQGGHASMLEERFVNSLAAALRPYLDRCR
jgi:thioesterase domain-containing protein